MAPGYNNLQKSGASRSKKAETPLISFLLALRYMMRFSSSGSPLFACIRMNQVRCCRQYQSAFRFYAHSLNTGCLGPLLLARAICTALEHLPFRTGASIGGASESGVSRGAGGNQLFCRLDVRTCVFYTLLVLNLRKLW